MKRPRTTSFAHTAFAALIALSSTRVVAAEPAPAANRSATVSAESALREPELLWKHVGCSGCHGEHGYYRDKIQGSLGKPVEAVARWIRSAPSIKPDTLMPDFQAKLSVEQSRALAAWVQRRAASER